MSDKEATIRYQKAAGLIGNCSSATDTASERQHATYLGAAAATTTATMSDCYRRRWQW